MILKGSDARVLMDGREIPWSKGFDASTPTVPDAISDSYLPGITSASIKVQKITYSPSFNAWIEYLNSLIRGMYEISEAEINFYARKAPRIWRALQRRRPGQRIKIDCGLKARSKRIRFEGLKC